MSMNQTILLAGF